MQALCPVKMRMFRDACAGGSGAESSAAHSLFLAAAAQVLSLLQDQLPPLHAENMQASHTLCIFLNLSTARKHVAAMLKCMWPASICTQVNMPDSLQLTWSLVSSAL